MVGRGFRGISLFQLELKTGFWRVLRGAEGGVF
jgi:hypothetical protein